ncbi:MAG: sigma-70 family RNA polymerase sigma factor [Acidobacteria bacterium]|nr:sigma-70 family RNA polymerase sigma factor [Acidobacteriota bacterium]
MNGRDADDERLGALMRTAQRGDGQAYLTLLQEIAPRVRRMVAARRGGSAALELEDLVQDVLLSVHVARASYDPTRPFLPWLLAIVRNRLADGARRYARHAAHEVQVDDLDVTFATAGTNSSSEVPGDAAALHAAIDALPRRQRQAVELLKLRELSLKEAAAATGMSLGALKVATHRAMAALRRRLAPSEHHGH